MVRNTDEGGAGAASDSLGHMGPRTTMGRRTALSVPPRALIEERRGTEQSQAHNLREWRGKEQERDGEE